MTALMLGTAQWGDAYGVTNSAGRLSDEAVAQIALTAEQARISEVDTHGQYGDAEFRLRPFAKQFAVTTKVTGGGDTLAQIDRSIERLGVTSLAAVLIHDWHALDCRSQGLSVLSLGQSLEARSVSRVGVSVYDAADLDSAAETFDAAGVPLGVVQVPANVLDRRLDGSSLLTELASTGAQIVVRSAFLQGVLLASGGGLADHPDVVRFREGAGVRSQSLLEACLTHVKALPWATHVLVGVTSAAELREIIAVWDACAPCLAPLTWQSLDEQLIDPRRW